MKKILFILLAISGLFFVSCEQEAKVEEQTFDLVMEVSIPECDDMWSCQTGNGAAYKTCSGNYYIVEQGNPPQQVTQGQALSFCQKKSPVTTNKAGDECNPSHCDPCVNHTRTCYRWFSPVNDWIICCPVAGQQCNIE